jgi:hypothetical protein
MKWHMAWVSCYSQGIWFILSCIDWHSSHLIWRNLRSSDLAAHQFPFPFVLPLQQPVGLGIYMGGCSIARTMQHRYLIDTSSLWGMRTSLWCCLPRLFHYWPLLSSRGMEVYCLVDRAPLSTSSLHILQPSCHRPWGSTSQTTYAK